MSLTESIEIENVVASTAIGQELDLQTLATDLSGANYDPDQFPGIAYRMQDPKAAALIFRSGKIVCTGAKSIDAVHAAVENLFETLAHIGLDVGDPELTVQNIVSSGDLGESLNLNAIAVGFGLEDVEYEPEQFPGLVYRMDDPDVVVLLFGSGKIVITGATEPTDPEEAIVVVEEKLAGLGLR